MDRIMGVLMMLFMVSGMVAYTPAVLLAGTDVSTEMALEEEDTGADQELTSLDPDAEDEEMIADSQHGR